MSGYKTLNTLSKELPQIQPKTSNFDFMSHLNSINDVIKIDQGKALVELSILFNAIYFELFEIRVINRIEPEKLLSMDNMRLSTVI